VSDRVFNVLFLCTHNSARSIMAEALLNAMGGGRFKAFSAGSQPSGKPNPFALEKAASLGQSPDLFRSKTWDEFAVAGAPHMDIIITVCDNAAGEACPIWPGHPATAHWGFPDPSGAPGGDEQKRKAFDDVFHAIRGRIQLLVDLPTAKLEHLSLKDELKRIGSTETA
jgi:arsenate reductase (thioredoxin)